MIEDLSWQSLSPVLIIGGQEKPLKNGEQFEMKLSDTRRCVGFNQYGSGAAPCPSSAIIPAGRDSQCEFCRKKDISFTAKTGFGNSKEANELLSEDHVAYLAYFSDNLIKVGVSRWDRREVRISEQGALACLFIAKGNGTAARNLERKIHTHVGLTEWVAQSKKLRAIGRDIPSEAAMRESLEEAFSSVVSKTPSALMLKEPMFLYLAPQYQLDSSIASKDIYLASMVNLGAHINGVIAGIYGKLILVKTPKDTVVAIPSEQLKGFSTVKNPHIKSGIQGIETKVLSIDRQQNLFDGLL